MTSSSPLRVGVLLCGPVQLLDLAAVDLLGMVTPEYLRLCGLPPHVVALGQELAFSYIAEGKKAGETEVVTAGAKIMTTHSLDNVGPLDILVVPGPALDYKPSPEIVAFFHRVVPQLSALLVVCSGILPVAFSGLLDGRTVTAPRLLLSILAQQVPKANWVDFRWAKDVQPREGEGQKPLEVWTSGAITNGTDMIAAYVKEKFSPSLAKFVCDGADVGERSREYGTPLSEFKIELSA